MKVELIAQVITLTQKHRYAKNKDGTTNYLLEEPYTVATCIITANGYSITGKLEIESSALKYLQSFSIFIDADVSPQVTEHKDDIPLPNGNPVPKAWP